MIFQAESGIGSCQAAEFPSEHQHPHPQKGSGRDGALAARGCERKSLLRYWSENLFGVSVPRVL